MQKTHLAGANEASARTAIRKTYGWSTGERGGPDPTETGSSSFTEFDE